MQPGEEKEAASPGIRFAERWADYTKAAAIYPDSNCRVREALASMLSSLPAATAGGDRAPGGGFVILFHRTDVEVGGETRALVPGTNLAWLADRLRHAALAGVHFHAGATDVAVLEFTRRLLSLWGRKDRDPKFEDFWPESYPGLRLIDWRFTGGFGGPADGEGAARPPEPAAPEGQGDLELEADEAVARELEGTPRIREALAGLQAAASERRPGVKPTRALDVIGQIVRQAPHDLIHDRETMTRLALEAIEELRQRLAGGPSGLTVDSALSRCVAESGRVLLGRADVTHGTAVPTAPPPAPPVNSGRDAGIEDDARAFRTDLAALPPAHGGGLAAPQMCSPAEQLGVLLHFLADPSEEGAAPPVRRHAFDLLAGAGPEEAAVLRQYIALPAGDPDGAAASRRNRVLGFLREAGLSRTLRKAGVVSGRGVLESFPDDFGLFLESIDPGKSKDIAELVQVVEALGEERVRAGRADLVTRERLLDPGRVDRLLRLDTPAVLPFLRVILEEGGPEMRALVVEALARLRGGDPVGCVLRFPGRSGDLPRSYLLGLTEEPPGRDNPQAFRRLVTTMICGFVRESAGRPDWIGARCAAIGHLAAAREPEALALLKELAGARSLALFPREPREIREAARRALRGGPRAYPEGR